MSDSHQLHPDLDALIGTTLHDRYRVDSLLGVGGMGAVFKAHHTGLDRDVAIKVLHPEIGRDPSVSKRFDREATSASRLDHPNCVRVTDFGTTETGTTYLVMELLAGSELEARLGRVWAPAAMVETAKQILSGLEHAHHFGIVHRDLKPENVFMTTDFRGEELVKLVDFGIAKLLDERGAEKLTRQGIVFGTPRYMSPEQAAGGKIDARSDLYAAGLIFYEMLAGHPPFVSDEPAQLLRMQIMTPPPPLPDTVPRPLADIVEKLLEKSKQDRFASAREVIDALDAVPSASLLAVGVMECAVGAAENRVAPTVNIPAAHSGAAWQPAPAPAPAPVRSGATITGAAGMSAGTAGMSATSGRRMAAARTGSHAGIGQPATGAFETVGDAGAGQGTGEFGWTGAHPSTSATQAFGADMSTTSFAHSGAYPSSEPRKRTWVPLAIAGVMLLLGFVAVGLLMSLLGADEDPRTGGAGNQPDTTDAAVAATGITSGITSGQLEAQPGDGAQLGVVPDGPAPGPTRPPTAQPTRVDPGARPTPKTEPKPHGNTDEKPALVDDETAPADKKAKPADEAKPADKQAKPADGTIEPSDSDAPVIDPADAKNKQADAEALERREKEAEKQAKKANKGKKAK